MKTPTMTGRVRSRDRQGFILVAVLGLLALLAFLTTAASVSVRTSLETVRLADEDVVLTGMIQAGLELTAYRLFVLNHPAEWLDGQAIPLAGSTTTRPGGGRVVATIQDEAARIDLNGAGPDVLASAYAASGAAGLTPEAFAARVLDWRDADDATGPGGAEAGAYAEADLPQRPPNRPFHAVAELGGLLGLDPDSLAVLAPLFTVFNPDGKVNVLTAPRAVVEALPEIARPTVEEVMERRREPTPAALDGLRGALARQAAAVKFVAGPAYRIRVTARIGQARSKSVTAVVAGAETGPRPYHIYDWSDR